MIISEEFLDLEELLAEAMQGLDVAVAHLVPPPPDQQQILPVALHQVPLPQDHAQTTPQGLLCNSESEPDSDDEMNQDLSWRNVQDIPSLHLMNIMRHAPKQPNGIQCDILDTENVSYLSLQKTTPPY